MQNLMGFLWQFTETGYCIPDIIKNITWRNLCSHDLFLQTQLHFMLH